MKASETKDSLLRREMTLNLIDNGLQMMKFASLGIEHKLADKKNKRIFAIMKEPNHRKKPLTITTGVKTYAKYKSLKEFEETLSRLDEIIKTNNC